MSKPNEPAYPNATPSHDEDGNLIISMDGGLSKREYFAGLAMQGLIAAHPPKPEMLNGMACAATMMADALIAELAKEPK